MDRGWAGHHPVPVQDGDGVLLHQELDALDMLLDDSVPPPPQGGIVEADLVEAAQAELATLLADPMQQIGRLEERLGGDAAPVQARSAQAVTLDEADLHAQLRGADGTHVAHAAAKDQQIEV